MASSGSSSGNPPLLDLPNETLLHIAFYLNLDSLSQWILTCRFFHDLLITLLYHNDIFCQGPLQSCRSVRHGLLRGHLGSLERAVKAGFDPRTRGHNDPDWLSQAITGHEPTSTVAFLLAHGASPRRRGETTLWPVISRVLDACSRPPTWCPLPVLKVLLEHHEEGAGSRGDGEDGQGLFRLHPAPVSMRSERYYAEFCAFRQWARVVSLHQVRGPRRRWVPRARRPYADSSALKTAGDSGEYVLRNDHCLHEEACSLLTTRLLLAHGADPNLRRPGDSLATLVVRGGREVRKPLDLLRCLAEAGADLNRGGCGGGPPPAYLRHDPDAPWPPPPPVIYRGLRNRPLPLAVVQAREALMQNQAWIPLTEADEPTPLQLAAADAVLLDSLARCPRGRNWDCHPAEGPRCARAAEVLRFLLARGVAVDPRSRRLLDRWDPRWRRLYRRAGGGGGDGGSGERSRSASPSRSRVDRGTRSA